VEEKPGSVESRENVGKSGDGGAGRPKTELATEMVGGEMVVAAEVVAAAVVVAAVVGELAPGHLPPAVMPMTTLIRNLWFPWIEADADQSERDKSAPVRDGLQLLGGGLSEVVVPRIEYRGATTRG